MIYLLAIIGLLALTYLAWRAFGPDAVAGRGEGDTRPPRRQMPRGPVGPDDDLEFLNDLDRKARDKDPKYRADGEDRPTSTD
ncbi:hypothetical protein DFR67_102253 [Williamsia limnetica]|jgi:hypothetical protein|uniref:Uncharacterized protein n=1 Tax=Williamsia limnetica TaxID=882452 RepID=A0A318RNA6_WILLI|nr:hypothetical protein [Williamsia limnetica]PYE20115.1 hypothetical protein DFR67_102253 [Williamsia limnetica]